MPTETKLHDITTDALRRLDDDLTEVWSRDEIDLYGRDGYDTFCRETKCVWDLVVIPNLPAVGGHTSVLSRHLAETTPGERVPERKVLITQPGERDRIKYPVPPVDTVVSTATYASGASGALGVARLPRDVVAVLRVAWDRQTLEHDSPAALRRKDPTFEAREGDPQKWLWSEDGLMAIRVWPSAGGDANYNTISGTRGFLRDTDDTTRTSDTTKAGGVKLGFIRVRTDGQAARSPRRGFVRRRHPHVKNVAVEVARLGRNPATFALEIPRVFHKYITFYAMHRALKRPGPGQDLKLAQHYLDRFNLGTARMTARVERQLAEHLGNMDGGGGERGRLGFSLPSWWGRPKPLRI